MAHNSYQLSIPSNRRSSGLIWDKTERLITIGLDSSLNSMASQTYRKCLSGRMNGPSITPIGEKMSPFSLVFHKRNVFLCLERTARGGQTPATQFMAIFVKWVQIRSQNWVKTRVVSVRHSTGSKTRTTGGLTSINDLSIAIGSVRAKWKPYRRDSSHGSTLPITADDETELWLRFTRITI